MYVKSEEEEQILITKLRRRIEDYLRKTHVGTLVKVAKVLLCHYVTV
jgi:hypothetical protein